MIRVLNREDKILVDSISLLSPLTGIGRYTYEVSKQLEEDNSLLIEYFYGYYYKKLIHPSSSKEIKGLKSFI
ncbi:MAG TPA: glycosyltransferase family 1 protein, partial [Sulfurovum sp.]|nr:glycosyltransferase family 1 protein [Sulfurovum sp.]